MSSWFRSWSVEEVEEQEDVEPSNTAGDEGNMEGGAVNTAAGEEVAQEAKES